MMDASKLPFRPPTTRPFAATAAAPRTARTLLSLAAGAALLLFLAAIVRPFSGADARFSIIIDAGSSGTRIHVFGYSFAPGSSIPTVDPASTAVMRSTPGLSAYGADRAGESLVELIDFAKNKVPKNHWAVTEIRLMATAGLRMLDLDSRDDILDSCRRVLRISGFRFIDEWASMIPGSDEGIYAWVTANYALGTLGGDPHATTGVIELGGASAQVTFVSDESFPEEFSRVLTFGETTYHLYSHSFLHFGQNAAHQSLRDILSSRPVNSSLAHSPRAIVDPCIPKGYSSDDKHAPLSYSEGNFSECRHAAWMLLQQEKDKCLYQRCLLGSTFVPELQGRFLATENFFYTSEFFQLKRTSSLSEFMLAGEQFCGADWLKLKKKYFGKKDEDLLRYCFSSAYIVALIHDSLGIALDDNRIEFANQVGSTPLNWALGAFIMQAVSSPNPVQSNWLASVIRGNFLLPLSLVILSLLAYTVWMVSKWRKPQFKTIYDLEKGRYIVTRISR